MNITLQPDCLRWARERAGLSVSELADKMNLKAEKIVAWEQSGELTLSRAQKLAKVTHTPFGYLFLRQPIEDELPIKDFRTVDMQEISRPSIDLLDTIFDAQERQDWYRDYVITNNYQPLPFVGSINVKDDILESAKKIRSVVNWNDSPTAQSSSWEQTLSLLINSVRDAGILVMRSGIVGNNTHRSLSVNEFRGFSLADEYAPLIFVNGNDAKAAQMFTLAHELVHIWLGESGVSNLRLTYSPDITTERFCNNVAAELLVPLKQLKEFWRSVESSAERYELVAKRFKVSKLVVLRRLRDANALSENDFQTLYTDELAQIHQRSKDKDKGGTGDFYATTRSRLGERFLFALLGSTLEGGTSYSDALRLLGVSRPETIQELGRKMGIAT